MAMWAEVVERKERRAEVARSALFARALTFIIEKD